jgi:hypothetical protein
MKLIPLTMAGALDVLIWRSEMPEALRTPHPISTERQRSWFNMLPERSDLLYFEAATDMKGTVYTRAAVCGFTDIDHINSRAQISLITKEGRKGYGSKAFLLLLDYAFSRMGLHSVYAECYTCNPNLPFWYKMREKYGGLDHDLPHTKYWDGEWHDSIVFTFINRGVSNDPGDS